MQAIAVVVFIPNGTKLTYQASIHDRLIDILTGFRHQVVADGAQININWLVNQTDDHRGDNLTIQVNLIGFHPDQPSLDSLAESIYGQLTKSGLIPSNIGRKRLRIDVIPQPDGVSYP